MKKILWLITMIPICGQAQLNYVVPLFDAPQNIASPFHYPSMEQSLEWSNIGYELSFYGIDKLGHVVLKNHHKQWRQTAFNYLLGFTFNKYASELPIPLGIWAHEEYHRSVLGAFHVSSKNGNWIFHRWDGTVYGPSDEDLARLKSQHLHGLLYSYVAGVQYETQLTKVNLTRSFTYVDNAYSSSLYLYNAYYVWNYFRFSTSDASNKVKEIAPEYESEYPEERDFAGADLTAWVYDMFAPDKPYSDREDFPNGFGENRRIGFSDLSEQGQQFLIRQRNLSLLNFLNPAIFLIQRIPIGNNCEVLPFIQYQPTHFGNSISLNIPISTNNQVYFVGLKQFNNNKHQSFGLEAAIYQIDSKFLNQLKSDIKINFWGQPEDYFSNRSKPGGAVQLNFNYPINERWSIYLQTGGKTNGWLEGNPYLKSNIATTFGLKFHAS